MLVKREFHVELFNGNVSALQGASQIGSSGKLLDITESSPVRTVIAHGSAFGVGVLAANATKALSLPQGYTSADLLFVMIRVNGAVNVVTVDASSSSSTVAMIGSQTQWGVFCSTDYLSSVSLVSKNSSQVYYEYSFVDLPDITNESSFYGLQSTGGFTNVQP